MNGAILVKFIESLAFFQTCETFMNFSKAAIYCWWGANATWKFQGFCHKLSIVWGQKKYVESREE